MSALIALAKRDIQLTVLAVVALGLVLMNPFLYLGWQSVDGLQVELEKEEMMANIQLMNAQSEYDADALQSRLYDLQRDIEELSGIVRLPEEAPSADLYDVLAKTAGWNGVTLVSLSSVSRPGTETIGDNEYRKSQIDVRVAGALSNIRSFMTSMEEGAYASLEFEGVSLTLPEDSLDWEGALTLAILSRS
ncbi:MAG: hypothetical protein V3S51_06990 [Dehalococcoidia bacterium]